MNFFYSEDGNHRIKKIYIENNGEQTSRISEFKLDKSEYFKYPKLQEELDNYAKEFNLEYSVEKYDSYTKIKFIEPISFFEYLKEVVKGKTPIIEANYMTKKQGQIYGKKRKQMLEEQAKRTKINDEIFKKKIWKRQEKEKLNKKIEDEKNELQEYLDLFNEKNKYGGN